MPLRLRVALLPATVLLFSVVALQAKEVGSLIRQGNRLDEQNRNSEALAVYRQAASLQEPDAELLWRMARQLSQMTADATTRAEKLQLGREALDYAQQAVKADPDNSQARLTLAICYGRLAELENPRTRMEYSRKILEEAEAAARLDPKNDYAWHVLGRWHYEMANLNLALRVIARTLYGTLPEASNDQAIEYLENAVRTGPPRVSHHIELGRAYLAADRISEARRELEKGLALPSKEKDDEVTKEKGREALRRLPVVN